MQEETTVLSNEQAGVGCRRLRLGAPGVAAVARPGQFVHVRVPALDPGAMRRPISICDADRASGVLTLLFKLVGRGTEALARVAPGDRVDILGPLGTGFPMPEAADVALVGGGYGVAPLYFLAKTLLGAPSAPRIALFVGGRSAPDILLAEDFSALGVDVHVATQDGSLGAHGLVTAPLDQWLKETLADKLHATCDARHATDARVALCACGPAPMLRALDERALRLGLPAWLSLDRRMACGVGACLGCVQRVRSGRGDETTLARVCVDGPVFPAGKIVWD